jgi:magnesium chelatase family protein
MVAKIKTFAFLGIEVVEVDVEVKISDGGLASFTIVGLPDKAVGESKERVRAAVLSTGIGWPYKKITVNLAPADIQKEGGHFDLPIALGILIEMGVINQKMLDNYFVLGELSLDASINNVNGIISAAIGANQRNCGIICPQINGKEAIWAAKEMDIVAAPNIISLINHLMGQQILAKPKNDKTLNQNHPNKLDLIDVKGQEIGKRALEIAAAGGHNLLFVGPPGTGKSMLASRLTSILPPPEIDEILEINMIHSINSSIEDGKLITFRPYRNPHHSCSMPSMVGGGVKAKPGEISLAHKGVLFLDELGEFPRQVLDSLRQPLETGEVSISRVNARINYPADFQLIAAMNPCRCGNLGNSALECKKAPNCGEEYKNKISGPFLDRIDLIVNIGQIDFFSEEIAVKRESSEIVLSRVIKAREIQKKRYQEENLDKSFKLNAKIDGKILEKFCEVDEEGKKILKKSAEKMSVSLRGINRILRVARTIADMENSIKINHHHLLEAISYRRKI